MLFDKVKMEFFGTFAIVYFTGLVYVQNRIEVLSLLETGVGTFLIYSFMLWAGRSISGSQYNPIVTLAMMLTNHIKLLNGCVYMLFQLIASIFAVCLVRITIPTEVASVLQDDTLLGFPILADVNPFRKMLVEFIGSFFFVFAYYSLLIEKNAPKYIYGAGIAAISFVFTLFSFAKSGGGLNPARQLSYSFVSGNYHDLYVFFIGPILGGILGGLLGNYLLSEKSEISKQKKKEEKKARQSIDLKKREV